MSTLLVEFSAGDETAVSVTPDGQSIRVQIGDRACELSRDEAADVRAALDDALRNRREFFRTAGEYREDGSYVVTRRCADSSGNAKVFERFEELRRLYARLPETFTAEDVATTGLTGSRRHMLVRHFAEHPAFACEIERRNPLTARKADGDDVEAVSTSAVE